MAYYLLLAKFEISI